MQASRHQKDEGKTIRHTGIGLPIRSSPTLTVWTWGQQLQFLSISSYKIECRRRPLSSTAFSNQWELWPRHVQLPLRRSVSETWKIISSLSFPDLVQPTIGNRCPRTKAANQRPRTTNYHPPTRKPNRINGKYRAPIDLRSGLKV